jgi:hypothetical protein
MKKASTIFLIIAFIVGALAPLVNSEVSWASHTTGKSEVCEACGMEVTAEDQMHYWVTDSSGKNHFVECYWCALMLIGKYENLHIESYCDWYGADYPITVDSTHYGQEITVNPPTAMFLDGRNCIVNRVAYNQTAADALLANGFSEHTTSSQHIALPATTQITTVYEQAKTYAATGEESQDAPVLVVILAVAGASVMVLSVFFYRRAKMHSN